ncbi:NAD(P)-binding Rossmann-fold containing protein [Glarea lozoyensis ATCC 20868]|uniref:NAD(P)-binding Rossmann-fold containing protein n=1 Tax=Glarea lozoyensis (strain ATCC 20868 / MF5171) TaxID=1116229 RepID=S3CZ27_GLAL2|nr:NAD(P)-binding Rossmann-fold containing protein [Glarea lozoyensis ATCC 20868]EPE25096.1 NAD(P)-binding Rossmann-fold containing protein [Glarea lozoyensis ATCC 20868]
MAPHADSPADQDVVQLEAPPRPPMSSNPPRILIIGAGSRGNAYARATGRSTNGIVVAVAEPIPYKRQRLGEAYIWGKSGPSEGQSFDDWKSFLSYELDRRERASRGEEVSEGVDAVFICTLDEQHMEVIVGLAELDLHVMCEKPLATTLEDCVKIYKALSPSEGKQKKIFSIGHVLRYSPHNMLLRKLLLEERIVGDVLSVNHTEPVGWWHFTHSYVRGNWRKESTTAPSLLTKSCHDIDLLLWLLCSPPPNSDKTAHIPTTVSSAGFLQYFNKSRKPTAAGDATNCLSCPIEKSCKYSAKKIYLGPDHKGLASGNTNWPVDIVLPEIEECISIKGQAGGEAALTAKLEEDYTTSTPATEVSSKNYFGRCVYEADNDVCDDQTVTLTWENDPLSSLSDPEKALQGRGAKTAIFHMVAHTRKICERYTHIYGTDGEIYADSTTITVEDFNTGATKIYKPHMAGGGHGGGDDGLARQFILAIDRVKNQGCEVERAQREEVGCSLEEVVRSHALVFCAEEARRGKTVVDWGNWWEKMVEGELGR